MTHLKSFIYGIFLPLRTLNLIRRSPRLLLLSAAPVLITAGLYIFLFVTLGGIARDAIIQQFISHGWNPHGLTAQVTVWLVRLLLLVAEALTFSFAANIASTPINDFLAEAAETWAEPKLPTVTNSGFGWRLKLIRVDLVKTLSALAAGLAIIPVSWLPIMNIFALLLAALLTTFQFISYPQTRRGQGVREGVRFITRHFFSSLGFGLATLFLFAIPGLNLLAMPLAVVGGTLLVAKTQETTSPNDNKKNTDWIRAT